MQNDPTRPVHFVAPIADDELVTIDALRISERKSNLWLDAWRDLRRRPLFWISLVVFFVVVVMSIWPTLFTQTDPRYCDLANSNEGAAPGHPMGYTFQGCDTYARVVWGARTSLAVGILATLLGSIIGLILGALAGFYGGLLDAVLSRVGDIFFSIPYVLAAVVVMSVFSDFRNVFTLAIGIGGFAWAGTARIVRAEVLRVRQADFVTASQALGLSRFKTLTRHVVPNAIAPWLVITTVGLASAIVAEATLSFIGVGIPNAISWGQDISNAQQSLRVAPMSLVWPSLALTITVLAVITLGELVRDALDPRARAQR